MQFFLKDSWNILDLIILSTSLGNLCFFPQNYQFNFGSFRLIRLLNIIKLKELNTLVFGLISAKNLLKEFFQIFVIFLLIYGISGVHLFSGMLKNRYFYRETGILAELNFQNLLCNNYKNSNKDPLMFCGKGLDNIDSGVSNFDNIFAGILQVFRIITQNRLFSLMNSLQSVLNSVIIIIYFSSMSFFGNIFLITLIISILKVKYAESHVKSEKKIPKNSEIAVYDLRKITRKKKTIKESLFSQNIQSNREIIKKKKKFNFCIDVNKNSFASNNSLSNFAKSSKQNSNCNSPLKSKHNSSFLIIHPNEKQKNFEFIRESLEKQENLNSRHKRKNTMNDNTQNSKIAENLINKFGRNKINSLESNLFFKQHNEKNSTFRSKTHISENSFQKVLEKNPKKISLFKKIYYLLLICVFSLRKNNILSTKMFYDANFELNLVRNFKFSIRVKTEEEYIDGNEANVLPLRFSLINIKIS